MGLYWTLWVEYSAVCIGTKLTGKWTSRTSLLLCFCVLLSFCFRFTDVCHLKLGCYAHDKRARKSEAATNPKREVLNISSLLRALMPHWLTLTFVLYWWIPRSLQLWCSYLWNVLGRTLSTLCGNIDVAMTLCKMVMWLCWCSSGTRL